MFGNVTFSILLFSTKKQYSSSLKKVFVFQLICFKVKISITFKISSHCHIKTCRSLKRRAILKPSTIFRRTRRASSGGSKGSGPLPFFDTIHILPSNSSANSEKMLCKISFKTKESIKTMYQQHSLRILKRGSSR